MSDWHLRSNSSGVLIISTADLRALALRARSPWRRWLCRQMRRPGSIGDLAYAAQDDPRFPDDPRRVVSYLRRRRRAPDYVLAAARRAVLEFREFEELMS